MRTTHVCAVQFIYITVYLLFRWSAWVGLRIDSEADWVLGKPGPRPRETLLGSELSKALLFSAVIQR